MAVSALRFVPLPRRAVLLLLGINALWGGSSFAGKAALAHVPPMSLAFIRFAISALLLFALASYRRVSLRVARKDWMPFWGIGALGITLTYLCAYVGLRLTTAADSALIHAAEPVFLAVLSVLMLREKLPRSHVIALAAGLGGVLLIVSRGVGSLRFSGAAGGDLLIALGLLFEAFSVILGKRLVARYPPLTVLTYQMLTGALLLAPGAIVDGLHSDWRLPTDIPAWPALWGLGYLVLGCTVLAYSVWFLLLDRHPASSLSAFLFVQPLCGAALGVAFQHDRLTLAGMAGAALVLVALAAIHRRAPGAEPLPAV